MGRFSRFDADDAHSIMRMRRINRRLAQRVSQVVEQDGADELLGFGDPRSFPGSVERFRWRARRWLTK